MCDKPFNEIHIYINTFFLSNNLKYCIGPFKALFSSVFVSLHLFFN